MGLNSTDSIYFRECENQLGKKIREFFRIVSTHAHIYADIDYDVNVRYHWIMKYVIN